VLRVARSGEQRHESDCQGRLRQALEYRHG
jgi:hypothetical protein